VPKAKQLNCLQRFAALRCPPKKNLIINRGLSGGYCKTAVSRWPFSQTKAKMKVTIKTTLITLEVEDEPKITNDGYTKRLLPELPIAVKSIIDEAIRIHNEVASSEVS
jgi:hypothetical protein